MPSSTPPRLSEGEASAELEESSSVGCAGDGACAARTNRRARVTEVGMVEGVDRIHPELELVTLCPNVERLTGGEIEDNLTGTVDVVPVVVAEGSNRG